MIIRICDKIKKYHVPIGRQGEYGVTEHVFDMSEYTDDYGNLNASLVFTDPRGNVFPCVLGQEGNNLHWTVELEHTQYAGTATACLSWYDKNKKKLTADIICKVEKSSAQVTTAPDPVKTWLDNVEEEKAELVRQGTEFAESAKASAESADTSAKDAEDSMLKARNIFSNFNTSVSSAISSVNSTGQRNRDDINSLATSVIQAINTKATETHNSIDTHTADAVNTVNTAKDAGKWEIETNTDDCIAEIEAKKKQTLDSIPDDYSRLSESIVEISTERNVDISDSISFDNPVQGYVNDSGVLVSATIARYSYKFDCGERVNISYKNVRCGSSYFSLAFFDERGVFIEGHKVTAEGADLEVKTPDGCSYGYLISTKSTIESVKSFGDIIFSLTGRIVSKSNTDFAEGLLYASDTDNVSKDNADFIKKGYVSSKNVWDKERTVKGSFNTSSGAISPSSSGSYYITDYFIPASDLLFYNIEKGGAPYHSSSTANKVLEFDADKKFLGYKSTGTYTPASNVAFTKVALATAYAESTSVTWGVFTEEITNWEEYFEPKRTYELDENVKVKASYSITEEDIKNIKASKIDSYIYLFGKIACIGDSLTRGFYAEFPSGERNRDFNYPTALHRMTGAEVVNFGYSGATPTQWFNKYGTTDFSSFDCAFICLGRNANLTSAEDKASYQSIISKLKADNPHINIFLLSMPPHAFYNTDADKATNAIIEGIANTNGIPYLDISENPLIKDNGYRSDNIHFYTVGYLLLAKAIVNSVNEYIYNHESDYLQMWVAKSNSDD